MSRRRFLCYNLVKKNIVGSGTYTVVLNDQWRLSGISNPDSSLYDGVYESFSNYNTGNSYAKMTIILNNIKNFTLYIRSYSETYYDYVMVSQLDKTIDKNTSYLYTELVKAHTRTTQSSGTDIYSYTPVTFENIDEGEHVITIIYRKDESGNSYDDRGYVLISKNFTSTDSDDTPGNEDTENMNPDNYLTIEALEDGLSAYLSNNSCEYCIDGDDNWVTLGAGQSTPSINTGQIISFKGNITPATSTGIGTFTISKTCNLKGNCMSMIFGDNAKNSYSLIGYNYAFCRLFYNCTSIKNVSEDFIPAIALASNCYYYMFYGCSNLITAPNLPATTLQSYCYYGMFCNCSNLSNAPIISATTLAYQCCYYMFYKCISLVTAPDLLAEKLESYCYYSMFNYCENMLYIKMLATDISASGCMTDWTKKVERKGGVFTKHINATWDISGSSGVPNKWDIQYYNPETGEITAQ